MTTFLDDDSHRVVDKKNCQWMAIGCNSPLQKQYPTKCKTFSLTQISSVDKNDRNSKNRKENIVCIIRTAETSPTKYRTGMHQIIRNDETTG